MADGPGNPDFKPGHNIGVSGRWKPGQSGNPKGRPLARPFKDALERQLAQLALSKGIAPELGHDVLAAALLSKGMNGDVAAIKEAMDRIDGKVPNPIGGTDELPPITAFAWRSSPDPQPAFKSSDHRRLDMYEQAIKEQAIKDSTEDSTEMTCKYPNDPNCPNMPSCPFCSAGAPRK